MAKVTVNHVYKIYPGEKGTTVTAVENVNLEIADREFVVLVGPSGCGKSTTLRMIAGLEEISRGDIYIGDRRVNDVAPKDRDIAMVFQNYALYPHMNVFDNMAFGLRLRKYAKTEIKKRVNDAASILGIEGLLDRKPKALSDLGIANHRPACRTFALACPQALIWRRQSMLVCADNPKSLLQLRHSPEQSNGHQP